jgi:pilus assembly protein Flp/PilA
MVNIMKTLNKMLKAFWQEESGLTVVEYAVAGTLISLAVVGAFTGLGAAVTTSIGRITTAL